MSPQRMVRSRATTSAVHVARALLTISIVSIVMTSIGAFVFSYHFLHQQTQRHLHTLMAVTSVESVAPLQFHDAGAAAEVLQAIPSQEGIALAELRDADGNLLAAVTDTRTDLSVRLARWIGTERLVQPVTVDGKRIGSVTLDGGSEPLLRILISLLGWCLMVILVVAITSLVFARRYTRRITQPIVELRAVVERLIEDRDFTQRAPPSDLREVEDLRREFNVLLDEIVMRDHLLRQTNAALKRVAYVDTLTGLPNRAMFEQALLRVSADCANSGERACLLFLDIDGFKSVNDTFGHAGGDALLGEIGARLRGWNSPTAIAARIGGDEFVLLVAPSGSADDAKSLIADLQQTLDAPIPLAGQVLYPGISIGYAVYPDMADDADQLIEIADQSMYKAKNLRHRQNRVTRWENQRDEARRARLRENRP